MDINIILLGLLPLVAFAIIDSFFSLKAGLISAILLALAEIFYSFYQFGSLDSLTIISLVLVLLLAGCSFKTQNSLYIKLQPVLLGVCFAGEFRQKL